MKWIPESLCLSWCNVKKTKHGSSFKLDEDKSEQLLTDEQWGDTENELIICLFFWYVFPSGDDH